MRAKVAELHNFHCIQDKYLSLFFIILIPTSLGISLLAHDGGCGDNLLILGTLIHWHNGNSELNSQKVDKFLFYVNLKYMTCMLDINILSELQGLV